MQTQRITPLLHSPAKESREGSDQIRQHGGAPVPPSERLGWHRQMTQRRASSPLLFDRMEAELAVKSIGVRF